MFQISILGIFYEIISNSYIFSRKNTGTWTSQFEDGWNGDRENFLKQNCNNIVWIFRKIECYGMLSMLNHANVLPYATLFNSIVMPSRLFFISRLFLLIFISFGALVDAIYLDFNKAFNSVLHERLLSAACWWRCSLW